MQEPNEVDKIDSLYDTWIDNGMIEGGHPLDRSLEISRPSDPPKKDAQVYINHEKCIVHLFWKDLFVLRHGGTMLHLEIMDIDVYSILRWTG